MIQKNQNKQQKQAITAKTGIVFYSRTGTTKKVAEELAKKLDATLIEVIDNKDRKGPIGYIKAGRDAMKKHLTGIQHEDIDISSFDTIIIGTPVWAWTITPAIRTFIEQNKKIMMEKNHAFFCTMGGSGNEQSFREMERLLGKKPYATLTLKTKEVVKSVSEEKIKKFVEELHKKSVFF
jgi:flavodoxin